MLKNIFLINFWAKIWGCIVLNVEVSKQDSNVRPQQLQVLTTYPKGTAWHLQHPFLPCMQIVVDQAWVRENEWLHNLVQSFHHKQCRGYRMEISKLFWSRLFRDRDNRGHFPERKYKMLVYGGFVNDLCRGVIYQESSPALHSVGSLLSPLRWSRAQGSVTVTSQIHFSRSILHRLFDDISRVFPARRQRRVFAL